MKVQKKPGCAPSRTYAAAATLPASPAAAVALPASDAYRIMRLPLISLAQKTDPGIKPQGQFCLSL